MKIKFNFFCVCVFIVLFFFILMIVSIMFYFFISVFKVGYESVEKGKDIYIFDYKMICIFFIDLFEKIGSVINVRIGE